MRFRARTPEERAERAAEREGDKLLRRQAKRDAARDARIAAGTYRAPGRPRVDPEAKKAKNTATRLRWEAETREKLAGEMRIAREALAAAKEAYAREADPTEETREALRAAKVAFTEKQEAFLSVNGWQGMIIRAYQRNGDLPSDPRSRGTIRYFTTAGKPAYDALFAEWVASVGAEVDDQGDGFGAKEWSPEEVAIIRERSRAAYVARGGVIREVGSNAIEEKEEKRSLDLKV